MSLLQKQMIIVSIRTFSCRAFSFNMRRDIHYYSPFHRVYLVVQVYKLVLILRPGTVLTLVACASQFELSISEKLRFLNV